MDASSGRRMIKYMNGTYVSDGEKVPLEYIREHDRKKLQDSPGKAFLIDVLSPRAMKRSFSPHRPRA